MRPQLEMRGGTWFQAGAALSMLFALVVVSSGDAQAQTVFADPFDYCAAVGTLDAPDSRWAGSATPDVVTEFFMREFDLGEDWRNPRFYVWRCFQDEVWGCFLGVNIFCLQAYTSREPRPSIVEFCQQNPGLGAPFVATGHDNIYIWTCEGTTPVIKDQIYHEDPRGFISENWYAVPGPVPAALPATGTGSRNASGRGSLAWAGVAGAATGAVLLGGATWYTKRRRLSR